MEGNLQSFQSFVATPLTLLVLWVQNLSHFWLSVSKIWHPSHTFGLSCYIAPIILLSSSHHALIFLLHCSDHPPTLLRSSSHPPPTLEGNEETHKVCQWITTPITLLAFWFQDLPPLSHFYISVPKICPKLTTPYHTFGSLCPKL